jgi:polyribonucleotide nucleotidyltransferase
MAVQKIEVPFGDATLVFEVGRVAELANGSVLTSWGDTVVLVTCVIATVPREGVDFFPLLVDFEERFYAAGKISGSRWIKREGKPSERAVLSSRLIDRPLRPLFTKDFKNDVQIIATVLSYDGMHDPAVVGIIGASAATMLAGAPFNGPVTAVRVAKIDGKLMINPALGDLEKSDLDLVVAGAHGRVMMLEGDANELSEDEIVAAIEVAMKSAENVAAAQNELVKKVGAKKLDLAEAHTSEAHEKIAKYVGDKIDQALTAKDKSKREGSVDALKKEVLAKFEGDFKQSELSLVFDELVEKRVRTLIVDKGLRPDDRAEDEIRPLSAEVGVLPRVHGSALFQRGQTQVLATLTLGSPGEEQMIETMEEETTKRFMHHYVFPPYSTGEVKSLRTVSRREIGHGALAERSLARMIPDKETFPYTIRLVSEVLSSNGSTSMASVCGSTLALMDGGVPIKEPVAGIAMGLMTKDKTLAPAKGKAAYKLLTDIQGIEDFSGDMDFKVAGTKNGITGIQVDTKVDGLTMEVIKEALAGAHKARLSILEVMRAAIDGPRKTLSPFAPRITAIKINPEKIREVIGPGGKTINRIIQESGGPTVTSIDIEDDGTVLVSSTSQEAAAKAVAWVENIAREAKPGEVYMGRVARTLDFGAFVEIWPGYEGMVHISQLRPYRVNKVTDVVKVGDVVPVKVLEIDDKGRLNLSIKAVSQSESAQDLITNDTTH